MKIHALVVAAIFCAVATPVFADDSQYNSHFEYGAAAKAIDIAHARLSASPTAYNDQYEYGASAKSSDLALTANAKQPNLCAERSGCVSTSIQETAFKPEVK